MAINTNFSVGQIKFNPATAPAAKAAPQAPTNTEAALPGESLNINFANAQAPIKEEVVVKAEAAPVQSEPAPAPAQPKTPETIQTKAGTTVSFAGNGTLMEFDTPALHPEVADMYFSGMLTGDLQVGGKELNGFEKANGLELSRRTITPKDLNFDEAAPVISSAKKFILPAPQFPGGGEPLVYPEGATNKEGQSIAGKPLTDYKGDPIGDKGVVFFNPKDQSWEGVTGDGKGVVIFNNLKDEQAKAVFDKVNEFGGDPNKLSLEQYKEVLSTAKEAGAGDFYHSDRDFIASKMNPLESDSSGIPQTGIAQYGVFRRDDRDVCDVMYVEGKGEFTGTATTHQYEDGAVILRQKNAKTEGGYDYRLIQPEVFTETYRNKDGSFVDLNKLPKG